MSAFTNLQKERRSIYALGKHVTQDDDSLFETIKDTIKETPSPFNSQSVQAVVLTGAAHEKLWDITLDALRAVVKDDEAFAQTKQKVDHAFKAGYGTVLYYTDQKIVDGLKEAFPSYAANFDSWAEESIGIALYAVWLRLREEGLGASLQHYNPLIDEAVRAAFDLPESWVLRGEMPFGSIEAPAADKDFLPDETRFRHFN
ncbi:nitroreductase family protein [Leuconostocaceae bacterium ESL0958]|nr:nitroreductase family protein [Leuconostocaceae bacterium ESL0958]